MKTAIAAFTPNIAWAEVSCREVVSWNGAGTSSATPQVAAAAALWLQSHAPAAGERNWQRAEAARHALFSSTDAYPEYAEQFGNGLLRADRALDVAPDLRLAKAPEDNVRFPWIKMLFGLETAPANPERQAMLEVEALQLFLSSASLQQMTDGADPDVDLLSTGQSKRLLAAMSQDARTSQTLRALLDDLISKL